MKAVGARLPRYDGLGHVTGRTQFVDDVRVGKTLWVKALRSPHHNAAITSLDTSKAEQMKGVYAVVTHADVPKNVYGHLEGLGVPADEPLLADGEVRYKGQPIAAVAAESEAAALAAVEAIEVTFEERPRSSTCGSRSTRTRRRSTSGATSIRTTARTTTAASARATSRARSTAPTSIVEGVYRPQAIEQMPMETQVALAVPEASGRLTIYSCTQAMYFSMGVVAAHLQVPLNKLKFVGGTVGGGFGGKVDTASETICALLALKARRPVKWRWTREEEFLASSTRAPWHIELADAVTKEGWILGRRTLTLHDSGAYARFSPYGVTKHAFHHSGAYTIPNLRFDGFVVFTNRVPTTAMRGFGVTSVSFAVETHMNRIAETIGIDPWELRLKNANRIGDTSGNGVVLEGPVDRAGDARGGRARRPRAERRPAGDDVRAAERRPAARAPRRATEPERGGRLMAKHRGRGFATIEYPTGMNQNGDPSQAWIKLKPDGRVDVFSGTVDIGQGSKTVHTQIVADALGVPYDWVTMDNTNTDSSAVCTGTFASRGTFIGGNAVRLAAERVRERILDIASKELEIDPADLEIADGEVVARGAPQKKISVADVGGRRDVQLRRADQRLVDRTEAVRRRRRRDRPGRDRAALRDQLRRVRR